MKLNSEPTELIPDKYYTDGNPLDAKDSFEELLAAKPEISCDHPDHTPADEWRAMPAPMWKKWMETGIKPQRRILE
jgi:hypothetical protein